jgi:DNA-binding MarR family transcriptional regulator
MLSRKSGIAQKEKNGMPNKTGDKRKKSIVTSEETRHDLLAHSLFNAARRYETRIIELIAAIGHDDIRNTHLTVMRNLDFDGTRITELARRAGMTKQSMSDLVLGCEKMGLVERCADETDRRAKKIIFTKKGRQLIEEIWDVVDRVNEEMAAKIGWANVTSLQTALKKYLA